jgi:hypothetical protein
MRPLVAGIASGLEVRRIERGAALVQRHDVMHLYRRGDLAPAPAWLA